MTSPLFQFGQRHPDYPVPVLNERAVRASAGILFFFAMIAFMNAWLIGNFQPTRVFVVVFLTDFSIRLFINPLWAPSMILGQWAVARQEPEWVGAPQKRFAWGVGFVLALAMLYLMVLNNVIGPINLLVCGLCLTLMFFEAAFGICLGCKLYNLFNKDQAQLCPGGVCAVPNAPRAKMNVAQVAVVLAFAGLTATVAQAVYRSGGPGAQSTAAGQAAASAPARPSPQPAPTASPALPASPVAAAEAERCTVPAFAKAIGHEDKWKLHNNCN
ncbi:MAG: DUF4395 domain-containing protein [Rhodoferax sp.]|nr:DUF4395 domain-containing protein [Rhodoferax sp.]